MHPIFASQDFVLLIARPLCHRCLGRCDLRSLSLLQRACSATRAALQDTMTGLREREGLRRRRVALCSRLIWELPVPLCSWHWVTVGEHGYESANTTTVRVTYNGRIVVLENGVTGGLSVVRATIIPSYVHTAGVVSVCSFARLHAPTHQYYLGKRMQTHVFRTTEQLIFLLVALTKLGSNIWSECHRPVIDRILPLGQIPMPLHRELEYPITMRPASAQTSSLFLV